MNEITSWSLITQGKYLEACKKAEVEYAETKADAALSHKVFALMQLGEYRTAIDTCQFAIANSTWGKSERDYLFAGIAYWLLDEYQEAISMFTAAMTAQYTDAAGGVEPPALLFFAATMRKDQQLEKEAIRQLKKRWRTKSIINWPGAIAGLLLGNVAPTEVYLAITTTEILRERHLCQFEFFLAVLAEKNGESAAYRRHLTLCVQYGAVCPLPLEYYFAVGLLRKM